MKQAPAMAFVSACPKPVQDALLSTYQAVLERPPNKFPTGTLLWRPMRGPMQGIYEIRDRHGRQLYRLFCLMDSDATRHGFAAPVLVMLCGGEKVVNTEMDDDIYEEACGYRDDYLRSNPRALLK